MRRPALILALALALLVPLGLVACGGEEDAASTAETVEGTLPADTSAEEGEGGGDVEGDPAAGEEIFAANGCGGCHTLEAAGTSGNIGPNLDEAQPSMEVAVETIRNGAGAMPPFEGQLDDQQIADVAAFVVDSTSG
jgi:mono/diheme cytochrome c family protein